MCSICRSSWFVFPLLLLLSGCASKQEARQATEAPATPGATMYALYAPIPADRMDAWKAMIDQLKAEHDAHVTANKAVGIDKEMVWLQDTPQGAGAVVYLEGQNPEGAMERREQAQDEHNKWFMAQLRAIHPLPESMDMLPVNRLAFKGDVDGVQGELHPYALMAPILPGKEAADSAFIAEMAGPRHDMWLESRRARGIAKEYVWNQKNPDGTMAAVVYFEVTDPANLNKPTTGEFETWFREGLRDIHGIPVNAPLPMNKLAGVW